MSYLDQTDKPIYTKQSSKTTWREKQSKDTPSCLPPNPETKEGKEKEGKDGKKSTIVLLKLLKVDTEELLVPINLRLRRTPETHWRF